MGLEDLLKQAGNLQKKIETMQEKLANTLYEGTSGAGMVKITIDGKCNLKSIKIDNSIINPSEKEIIEDLIIAAFNDAKRKMEEGLKSAMSEAAGGLPFNLPF